MFDFFKACVASLLNMQELINYNSKTVIFHPLPPSHTTCGFASLSFSNIREDPTAFPITFKCLNNFVFNFWKVFSNLIPNFNLLSSYSFSLTWQNSDPWLGKRRNKGGSSSVLFFPLYHFFLCTQY